MRLLSRLRHDTRGATAIEYALLAGLIGLGIVGSLVTTKGSLSSVFGTASTQMGSSTAAPAGSASTSARAAFWSEKTLAAPPVRTMYGMTAETVYTYTDGTVATYQNNYGESHYLFVRSPLDKTFIVSFGDATGLPTLLARNDYAADMSTILQYRRVSGSDILNGVPKTMDVDNTGNKYPADQTMLTTYSNQYNDTKYFMDISKNK